MTETTRARFADCELDLAAFEFRRAGEACPIEPQVFDFLAYLVRNADRLVTRDELIEKLWNGRIVSDTALSTRIKSARRAIGDDGEQQKLIRTVHGRGLRFVGQVSWTPESPSDAAPSLQSVESVQLDPDSAESPRPISGDRIVSISTPNCDPDIRMDSEKAACACGAQSPGASPTPPRQDIRFCRTSDHVRIGYATSGDGPPLVKPANWLTHLEYDWDSPIWRHWIRELSRDHRLIRYDERANGLSDWAAEDLSLDALVRDLEAVVDAAGLDRFPMLGVSQGSAIAIAYAVRNPGRVSHLIMYGGYARGWAKRGSAAECARRHALGTLIEHGWGQDNPAFRQVFASLFMPGGTAQHMRWFNDLQRMTTSPANALRLHEAFGQVDVQHLLAKVDVPTLILHGRNDAAVPVEEGRLLACGIPNARFVSLESENHILLESEPAWPKFLAEVRSFLSSGTAGHEKRRAMAGR